MKRLSILGALVLFFACLAPGARAQTSGDYNRGNLGAFVDFTRQQGADVNMLGVGARVGFNLQPHVVLEGEMAYDFEQTKTETVTVGSLTTTTRSTLRLLHAVAGLKFQTTGDFRIFVMAKAGLLNFGVGGPVTAGAISTQIGNINDGVTKGVLYPGGGVEFGHRLSFRAEIGDEIYFANGTHHNIRVTAGPQIRF
jgi:opacity protein-like surface antigen